MSSESIAGYAALHESAAWLDISSRGRIAALGEDRQRLLHAIASNAVEGLAPGQGTYAFFLNVQGRIQADSRLFVCEDRVLIDCEPEVRQTLRQHIDSYIIMDDVRLEDMAAPNSSTSPEPVTPQPVTPDPAAQEPVAQEPVAPEHAMLDAIALEGPRSEEIARHALGAALPGPALFSHGESQGIRTLRSTLSGQAGLWFFCPPERKNDLVAKLEAAGAAAASAEDFRVARVENRRPRFGDDYSSTNIPHETGLLQAVSFSKGCYLGQEIVERVRARGQVNKRLVSLEFDTRQPLQAGAAVEHAGHPAGQLSSPVFSPRRGMVLAFAILRREAAAPGNAVTAGGVAGRVLPLP
jgi:aminomethyltransferase